MVAKAGHRGSAVKLAGLPVGDDDPFMAKSLGIFWGYFGDILGMVDE